MAKCVVRGEEPVFGAGEEGDEAAMRYAFSAMAERVRYSVDSLSEDKRFMKNLLSDISHQLKPRFPPCGCTMRFFFPGRSFPKKTDRLPDPEPRADRPHRLAGAGTAQDGAGGVGRGGDEPAALLSAGYGGYGRPSLLKGAGSPQGRDACKRRPRRPHAQA